MTKFAEITNPIPLLLRPQRMEIKWIGNSCVFGKYANMWLADFDHIIAFHVNNCFMDCFRTILLLESSIFFCNLTFVQIFSGLFYSISGFRGIIGSLSSSKHVISEVQSDLFPSSLFLESFTQKTTERYFFFSKLRQESRDMSELKKLKSRERDLVKQLKSFTQV